MSQPQDGQYSIFNTGDVIIGQGVEGDSAYYIEQGHVEILRETEDGTLYRLSTRGPGTFVGEMALVDQQARTATVRACEECHLLEVTRADFERRLDAADPVVQTIIGIILTRYRDMLTRAQIFDQGAGFPPPELVERDLASDSDALNTLKLENDFKKALQNDELYLLYHPIIDLATGKVKGFEALMRWQHPERGMISPADFIPMAEESGLIVEASKWALDEACRTLKRIEEKFGNGHSYYISVNFTSKDFAQPDFLQTVHSILARHDVAPSAITLEITERMLMDDPGNAKETLQACRDAGFHVAIDDFGIGYSSLSYLHYFPINMLKIDKAFVQDICHDESAYVLIKSIIALGQSLNMTVVAEGVETANDAEKLAELSCDSGQGFYYTKPLSANSLSDYLADRSAEDRL